MTRLRDAARRLRPTSRAGALKALAAGSALVVVLGVAAVALWIAVPAVYGEYGRHPETTARSWAALVPQYAADPSLCQSCHETEHAPWSAGPHAVVACDSCHGPLAEHAANAPAQAAPGQLLVEAPPEGLCALCHAQVPGRPLELAQVDTTQHYPTAPCVGCHDSHRASAVQPPEISHSLARLPACTTCHAPAGLKPVPVGHEEAPDAVCRSCHRLPATGTRSVP